jgi:DNA-binding CsgD family transcriptional regulator
MTYRRSFDVNSLAGNTLRFAQSTLGASAGFFCWLSPTGDILEPELSGLDLGGWDEYVSRFACHDPLNIARSVAEKKQLLLYSRECSRCDVRAYERFRAFHSIADELSFIFWADGQPFAAMAAIKTGRDRPFSAESSNWTAMRDYFEFTLSAHPRVRKKRLHRTLNQRFGMTMREIEVAEFVCNGDSNAAIASALNIGVATVKTHISNVFAKLDVESRAAVAAYCQEL